LASVLSNGKVALALLGCLACTAAMAAGKETKPAEECESCDAAEEIVISAQREQEQGISVTRIERDRIERFNASSAAEVIEMLPSAFATSGQRGERIFSLRGFDQRQLAVLLDGVPFSIPYDGQIDLGMLPAALIERVSVIKGPGSVLYGPNGMGGAVNIVTRRPGDVPLLGVAFMGDPRGAVRFNAYGSARRGNLGYTLVGGVNRLDGFPLSSRFKSEPRQDGDIRNNSDKESLFLLAGGEWRPAKDQRLFVSSLIIEGKRGVPCGLGDVRPRFWRFSNWRTVGLTLGHAGKLGSLFETDETLYARLYNNQIDSYDDASYTTQSAKWAFTSLYRDQAFGGRVRARSVPLDSPWGPTLLRLWAGAQHDRHVAGQPGRPDEPTVSRTLVTLAPEAEALIAPRLTLTASLQTDIELPTDDASVHPNERFGFGPLVSLGYEPLDGLFLRATVARRTRFASLKERFSSAIGLRLPNPDLGPERAWHFGLEATYAPCRRLHASLAIFDAEVQGLINAVALQTESGPQEQLQNAGSSRLSGLEAELVLQPIGRLEIEAGVQYLRARQLEARAGEDRIAYRPQHKAYLEARLRPCAWLGIDIGLSVIGSRDYQNPGSFAWEKLSGYLVWDMGLSLRPSDCVTLRITARNLADDDHQSEYGFPDPGLWVWAGVEMRS